MEDYFAILNLPKKYNIELAQIKSQYLSLQLQFHPDRAADEKQRHQFLERSMKLNEAEKILKDDYLRAEHMLKLAGIEFNDHVLRDAISTKELEEIMEAYEKVDNMNNINDLQEMERIKTLEKQGMVTELSSYFSTNKMAKALDLTVRLKYLTNLVKNIKLKIKNANSRDIRTG